MPEPLRITVGLATPDENSVAIAIAERAFAGLRTIYRPKQGVVIDQTSQPDDAVRAIARIDREPVGTIQYVLEPDRLYVFGLAVDTAHRHRGVARSLLDFVDDVCRRFDCLTVTLRTIRETGNVAIFERLGFQVVKEEIADWCVSDQHSQLHEVHLERSVAL